jgi:hypothetical protein
LEVPLDSYVGKGLLSEREAEGSALIWRTIAGLTPATHERFQQLAQKVADRKKITRVHLDVYYFRQDEN